MSFVLIGGVFAVVASGALWLEAKFFDWLHRRFLDPWYERQLARLSTKSVEGAPEGVSVLGKEQQ